MSTLPIDDKLDTTRHTFLRQGSAFVNPNGSWHEAEVVVADILVYGQVIEDLINDLANAVETYNTAALKACAAAPKVDTLFYDSPISPANVQLNLRRYIKKVELGIVRDVHEPSVSIKNFSEMTREACRWILKFKNEKTV